MNCQKHPTGKPNNVAFANTTTFVEQPHFKFMPQTL